MLLGNKERVIKLHAENFLSGNITFDYGIVEDERHALAGESKNLSKDLENWLIATYDDKDTSEEYKAMTDKLYRLIIHWRVRGRIRGILQDIDLEEENKKLKDDNIKYRLQYEEARKDAIIALKELQDKNSLIEQYEQSLGLKKP